MKSLLKKIFLPFANFLTPVRIVVILVISLFFWFVILGDQGIYKLQKLILMKNRLTMERSQLSDEIDKLSEQKNILSDPANMEMTIRSELGYIKPGEVVFEAKKESQK